MIVFQKGFSRTLGFYLPDPPGITAFQIARVRQFSSLNKSQYELTSLHFALFGRLIPLKQDSRGKRLRFDEFQIDALPIWK